MNRRPRLAGFDPFRTKPKGPRTWRIAELVSVEVPELYDATLLGTHEFGFI
jgi:hypothetical protein